MHRRALGGAVSKSPEITPRSATLQWTLGEFGTNLAGAKQLSPVFEAGGYSW